MKFIFKRKHRKGCLSLRTVFDGVWKTPWVNPEMIWKRSNQWIRLRCNDTKCHATVEFSVEQMIIELKMPIFSA